MVRWDLEAGGRKSSLAPGKDEPLDQGLGLESGPCRGFLCADLLL